jgi:hypothetical protein
VCANGIDDDCDGTMDEDPDDDGDGFTACGGDCCDEQGPECANPELVNPGAFEVDGNTVVALYPIEFYNSETGSHAITHWAIVLYDMSTLAVDNGRVLSLFITTLFIALILGFVLFYFLYKVVENPIRSMNKQLDVALKEGLDTVQVSYQFPAMQTLASNVSSALTRALRGGLDVPKERWISYPGCERGADTSLPITWAGWNHLQQATALAAYYLEMKENEGWDAARLQPLLAGLLEFGPAEAFLMVGVVYGSGQVFEGFFLTPRLVGERIGLHPLAVIFALLAFGQLLGFVGVLIALPASAVLLVAIRRARATYLGSKLYQS